MSKFWPRKTLRILLDIDSQMDNFDSLPDWKRSDTVKNIRRLVAWARRNKITVISTAICYRPEDINGNGQPRKICIEDTPGQKKISYTLLPSHIRFEADKSTDLPEDLINKYQQIIFEKRTPDTFQQPRADRFLTNIKANEFIVMGTHVDTALCATVLGLISRRQNVSIVTDAIFCNDQENCDLALRKMEAKGAKLITTESVTGKRRVHAKLTKVSSSS